ncbi:MAG: hypothetical protein CBB68_03165, partial [Rhodospirillaceae bacterium TMED8]
MANVSKVSLDDQDGLNDAYHEIRHLKDTLFILREELESQEFIRNSAVQKAVQHSADEIQQLKNTATSLRDELESLRYEKDAAVQQ